MSPYAGELARIKAKLTPLLEGYEPEWARTGGTLIGYDAVTDHAVVTVQMPKGDIHFHTSLSWTMEWKVPDAAPKVPAAPPAPTYTPPKV